MWEEIKNPLLNSLNYSLNNLQLTEDQKTGLITLIPKKDKDRTHIQNWRPISLLNNDYKLLTKVLANRLIMFLPKLINEDQTGYVPNRYIGCNIRKLEDCIQFLNNHRKQGIILNIDYEKAFDSLNHQLILKTLNHLNFGTKFISYIKTIYNDIKGQIFNYGNISETFKVERGVRQGCP